MTNITKVLSVDIGRKYPEIVTIPAHELNVSSFFLKVTLWYEDEPFNIGPNDTITATLVTNGVLITDERRCERISASTIQVNLSNENGEDPILQPGKMLVQITIDSQNGNSYTLPFVIVANVAGDIKQSAQVSPESYGTVAEILQEVALARGNFNTLGDRLDDVDSDIATLDNSKLPFTVLPTSSTYSESVFSNNQATGTVYAVYMAGTAYWFFNAKVGQDITLQYRFSKNGIEIKGGSMTEWLNIGGKGDEVVAARGGFADLDARLDDMGHDIETLIVEVNQGIPSDLAGKMNVKTATGTLSTAFDNNLDLKTLYYIGRGLNLYYFLNLDDSTQLRYNANLGFELREKENDTWGEWAPAIADGSISNDMLNSALQNAIVLANRSIQYKFLGNVSGSDEASAFADNTDPKYIYRVGTRGTYYDFINLSSDIQCRLSKFGVELRKKTNDTWGNWTYFVEENDRSKLLSMYNDFSTKTYTDVVDLGELGETTSLDNEDYCLESRHYLFKAVNNLTGILHVPANTVCVLTNANGYQIVEPVNIAVKIIRKVNAVRPTFNADPWEFITKTLSSGEVLWDNLATAVKTRITDVESGVTDLASGKLDYIDDSDNTIWTTAALNSYDFDSDKLYQVMLNGKVLGAYEPAQIALVFQSDSFTRIIIGAKSGVFYSTYDSQTEEWSDPVKSLDKATERQLNNFEQRISALETANTILSNAINGVS